MLLVNLLKVGAIWVADTINKIYNPFKKVTFASDPHLYEWEHLFYNDLMSKFVDHGRFSYELPMPADRGDAALFQGLYTAMINMKFKETCTEVQEANAALGSYFVDGTLIRGYRSDGTVNDTTSNDAATGVLLGLYSIWRRSTWEADSTIQRWAECIIDGGYALTDLKGKPTVYGKLEDGIKTDPLRITLLLAILALAARCCKEDDNRYKVHYTALYRKYRLLLRYPKVSLLWWDTDYDTHRAAIHLHVLYNLTGDTVYLDSMRRLARITEKENNAWVQILCWPANGLNIDLSVLDTFDSWVRRDGNQYNDTQDYDPVETVKWGGKTRAKGTQPICRRGSQEFFWQRNMFSVDEWKGNTTASVYHSGLDFLIAFWFAKRLTLLK